MIARYVVRDYTNPNRSRKMDSYDNLKSAVRYVKELMRDDGIGRVWKPDVLSIEKTKYANENYEQRDTALTRSFVWSGWVHEISDLDKLEV